MNLANARVVLRERSVTEILDLALTWCFVTDRRLFARLAAWVLTPALLLCLALRYLADAPWGVTWWLALALGSVLQGVFTIATGRAMFADKVTLREVLAQFARRLVPFATSLLLSRAILMFLSLTLFLAPVAWVRTCFVHEASLLEGFGPWAAVDRASRSTVRRFGALFFVVPGLWLVQMVATLFVDLLGTGVTQDLLQLGTPLGSLAQEGGSVFALLGFFAAVPYVAVARFLAYVDERTRRDGWDVQVRFMGLTATTQDQGRDG